MMLKEKSKAPEFSLRNQDGEEVSLSDFKGKRVVLYFYPKDDTPGCTTEACNFRDDYSQYKEAEVIILGVSPDSEKSHAKFSSKHQLPFPILVDVDHQVCELYGVWGKKKFMGKEYDGVLRTTFIIDREGNIVKIFEGVKPTNHSEEVLKVLKKIQGTI